MKNVNLCLLLITCLFGVPSLFAVTPPTLNPQKGESFTVFPLLISCPDAGADIRYTVNGLEPTLNDQKVESGETIIINRNWTIKAKAWVAGTGSSVTTGDFVLTGDIAAGGSHSLALSASGNISSWGLQTSGRLANLLSTATNVTLPGAARYLKSPVTDARMLAAGGSHSLFLKEGGSVWTAGLNTSGQLGNGTLTLQSSAVQVIKGTGSVGSLSGCSGIAAGDSFSLALASNGEVWSWGNKAAGALGDGTTTGTNPYAGKVFSGTTGSVPLAGIGRISARGSSGLALEPATGNVWAWGNNASGQLGQGNVIALSRALRVKQNAATFLTDALDISNGEGHSAVLRWKTGDPALQGRVFCFGQQQYGRLGNNNVAVGSVTYPVQVVKIGGIPLDGVVSVAAGTAHTLALDLNGNVWAWGFNQYGALGDNTVLSSGVAVKVKNPTGTGDLTNIVRIAAGGTGLLGHSMAVAANGTVYTWGYNINGQLGNGTASATVVKLPVVVGANLDLLLQAPEVSVSANVTQGQAPGTVVLTASPTDADNNILKVEFYCQGRLVGTASSSPWQVTVQGVAAGASEAVAKVIDSTGLYGTSAPVSFTVSPDPASGDHDRDGLPNTWESQYGLNPLSSSGNDGPDGDMDGDGFSNFWEFIQGSVPNVANSQPKGLVATGQYHTIAIATDGRVWSWGNNPQGVLGDGTTTTRNSPVLVPRVPGMKRIIKVDTGLNFTLALDEAGSLWGWGSNNYNLLSPNSASSFLIPIKMGFKSPVTNFACGGEHIIVSERSGKVWTWGRNNYGQLGLGHTNAVATPTELIRPVGMGEVIALEASSHSTFAVDASGNVWAWGYNLYGRLGDGTTTSRSVPVPVSLSSGMPAIASISSIDSHVIALGTNGTVWTWGYNGYGQLGTGNTSSSSVPVAVTSGFSLGTGIAAGASHSMVISQTGVVWSWGYNTSGQLGTGTTINSYTPIITSTPSGWNSVVAISAGHSHSFGLKSDGSLWSWGLGSNGQLGHGNTSSLSNPTQLINLKSCQDDSDSDGMPDSWEKFYFGNLTQSAAAVFTTGGAINLVAYSKGLNPSQIDYDKDGIPDIAELSSGLDPLDWTDATGDLDGDRIPNLWEYSMGTSMLDPGSKPPVNATVVSGQTIQSAVNAISGNTTNPPWIIIQVESGIYNEVVNLPSNKRVLLISGTTGIPEIRGVSGSASLYAYGECVVDGFRITHGKGATGNGVYVSVSSIKFPVRITNCVIQGNSGNYQGGGIEVQGGRVVASHCTLFKNSATSQGNAVWVGSSSTLCLINSILWNPAGTAAEEARNLGNLMSDSSYVRDGSASGSILGNPLINPSGFLTKASPARFAGTRKGGVRLDIQRENRGNLPDIGADQFCDLDNDGLPDDLEALGITSTTADNDSDGLTNLQEYEIRGTSPTVADTDGDGLSDSGELAAGTDALDPDSDSDGMLDGKEVLFGLSPLDDSDALTDMDGDRIPNVFEIANNTLPNSAASFPPPFITVDPSVFTETASVKKTIQAAASSNILPSSGYMIVRVKPGTYAESVSIDSRKILLLGDLGVNPPIISPVSGQSIRIFENAAVIDGFWIRRSANNSSGNGIYVYMDKASDQSRMVNCMITGFTRSSASAMEIARGRTSVVHCTLVENSGTNTSRAITVGNACKLSVQNSILWNIDKGAANEIYEGRIQTANEYRRRDSSVSGLIGSWFLARFAATRDVADGRA